MYKAKTHRGQVHSIRADCEYVKGVTSDEGTENYHPTLLFNSFVSVFQATTLPF